MLVYPRKDLKMVKRKRKKQRCLVNKFRLRHFLIKHDQTLLAVRKQEKFTGF